MVAIDAVQPKEHITASEASALLADTLSEIASRMSEAVRVERLGKVKTVEDATAKFLVQTVSDRRAAVIIFSNPAAPDLVARASANADQVRGLLGPPFADVIPKPLFKGYAGGRSYEVLPYFRELPSHRLLRKLRWRSLRRPVLDWLEGACAESVRKLEDRDAHENFAIELDHLRSQEFIDRELLAAIDVSMARLEAGEWRPRHTLDHNDVWQGNVMLPHRSPLVPATQPPFMMIDWAGANMHGYGIYDIVRAALAFGLSPSTLAARLRAHCTALGVDLSDARGHLMASLGRLHRHIEHFPEEKYIATFRRCWQELDSALSYAATRRN